MELPHKSLSLKEAIANLAYKLAEGTSVAIIAIVEFKELIEGLSSEDLKHKIFGLHILQKNEPLSLEDVFVKIDKGLCVKRAASHVTNILNKNIANEILEIKLDSAKRHSETNQCLVLFTIVQDVNEGLKFIKKYLHHLSEEELLKVVKEKNHDKNSIVHIAARDPDDHRRVLEILTLIEPKHRLEVVQELNCNGDPLTHILADRDDKYASFSEMLSLLPPEDRLQAINTKDHLSGNSILHSMAILSISIEGLIITLESLPKEARLEAIKTKNDDDLSLLDILVKNSKEESLQVILSIVPEAKSEIENLRRQKTINASEYSASFINTMTKANAEAEDAIPNKKSTGTDNETKKQWVMPQKKK